MTYWIFPWRPSVFDLPRSLNDYGYVEWRQQNIVSVGDIVFIYCTKPVAQILYMFRVSKTDIPYIETINKNYLFSSTQPLPPSDCYLRLKPITEAIEYNPELTYQRLRQLGLKSKLQNNIKVTGSILSHILENFDIVYNNVTKTYDEGNAHQVAVTSYERNPLARFECLNHFGYSCQICGFNFQELYGEIGKSFIHVHHIKFISSNRGNVYQINPLIDLIPVCPNCHAMLHRKLNGKYLSPAELKRLISE